MAAFGDPRPGQGELRAYEVLVRAPPGCMVLAKVPLARFVKVPRRHSYSEWLRRLGYQCADLVVCDAASTVLAVVNVRPSAIEASARAVKRQRRMARVLGRPGSRCSTGRTTRCPASRSA